MEINKIKRIKIKKITHIENEDVYDINVDKNHNFFANGILVHNCGEQVLPIGGVCLLGSINLTQFIDFKNKNWDYTKLEKYIPYIVRLT
jgi:ribonucleoside-diphosphate reductase alpha chain